MFNVGIKEFDDHHQTLIEMVNEILDVNEKEQSRDLVLPMIDKLIGFVESHFHSEELLMKEHHFPGFEEHRHEHSKLLKEITTFKGELEIGSSVTVSEFSGFLTGWLLDHILTTDNAYTTFLMAKGVT